MSAADDRTHVVKEGWLWKRGKFAHLQGANIRNTDRQYSGHNTPLGYHTDQGMQGRGQYDGKGSIVA